MILISVQNVRKGFGANEVLRDVTFSLQKGEKMGLIGANGCGKTTLMRLISGETQPDEGAIHMSKDLRVGYLAQISDIDPADTVRGAMLRVFEAVIAVEKRLGELEKEMAHTAGDEQACAAPVGRIPAADRAVHPHGGYALRRRDHRVVLSGLGIGRKWTPAGVGTLSGGERTRLALAKLLCKSPTYC
jgi:ATP-binding cassette subfamily F protein 3